MVESRFERLFAQKKYKLNRSFQSWKRNTHTAKLLGKLIKIKRLCVMKQIFRSFAVCERSSYSKQIESLDQALIFTTALVVSKLDSSLKQQLASIKLQHKNSLLARVAVTGSCFKLRRCFSRWSNIITYTQKLRLADNVAVVLQERRELEQKVRQVQDENEAKERFIESS